MEWSLQREPAGAAAPELVEVKVADGSDPVVVTVSGKILYDTHRPLIERLLPLAERPQSRLVIDLSGVPMCDSSGLNLLVQAYRRAIGNGGWVRLAGTRPMVRKVLAVTNLDRVLPLYESVADAVADPGPA